MNDQKKNEYEKMAEAFEIEELEERVEFNKWELTASGGCSSGEGCHGEGSVTLKT